MIITCPSCSLRFAVKSEAIGLTGRKVRCATCRHDWFQELSAEEAALVAAANIAQEPTKIEPLKDGSNLPAALKSNPTPLYFKISAACAGLVFLFSLSIASSNKILPYMSWYYGIFGIYDDKDLALYDISAQKDADTDKKDILVKGRIVNQGKIEKTVPMIRVTLIDDKNKILKELTLRPEQVKLAAGEGVNFENHITNFPEEVADVILDLGNKASLAAR